MPCRQRWYGTAPFCSPECPANTKKVQESNCGDGACCWTGSKFLCQECDMCDWVYVGTSPYCNVDESDCPIGYHADGTSDCGDGACCLIGYKIRCRENNCV